MKIVCISNILNHHTKPICDELYKRNGKDFVFIATGSYTVNGLKGIDKTTFLNLPYLFLTHNNKKNLELAHKLCFDADVLIQQHASDDFIYERLKKNKLTFRISERIFKGKKGDFLRKVKYIFRNFPYRNKNLFLLAAGAYVSQDMSRCLSFKSKTYKWGYFPEISKTRKNQRRYEINKKFKFVWVGRFIAWKHPETCLIVAEILKNWDINFEINMIGEGPLKTSIIEKTCAKNLQNKITFFNRMSNQEVQEQMSDSHFFIFSSDKGEGWGAVLNEAMSHGTIPIASHEAGSVPFLIKNNKNGYIYEQGNKKSLENVLREILLNKDILSEVSKNAKKTIEVNWSAQNAVNNLLKLINIINKQTSEKISCGPGSVALPIGENEFFNNIVEKGEKHE